MSDKRKLEELDAKLRALKRKKIDIRAKISEIKDKISDATIMDRLPTAFHHLVESGILSKLDVSERETLECGGTYYIDISVKVSRHRLDTCLLTSLSGYKDAYFDQIFDDREWLAPFKSSDQDQENISWKSAWDTTLKRYQKSKQAPNATSADPKVFARILANLALYCHCVHDGKTLRQVFPNATLHSIDLPSPPVILL